MFDHPKFDIQAEPMPDGKRKVTVRAKDENSFVFRKSCVTSYDDKTIEAIMGAKGASYLCDEIARDEDPHYIRSHVTATLTGHIDPQQLDGRRFLDF